MFFRKRTSAPWFVERLEAALEFLVPPLYVDDRDKLTVICFVVAYSDGLVDQLKMSPEQKTLLGPMVDAFFQRHFSNLPNVSVIRALSYVKLKRSAAAVGHEDTLAIAQHYMQGLAVGSLPPDANARVAAKIVDAFVEASVRGGYV